MATAKFSLGRIVTTPGALAALSQANQNPVAFLSRHQQGDWGEVPEEDKKENEFSVLHDLRVLSAYTLTTGVKIWLSGVAIWLFWYIVLRKFRYRQVVLKLSNAETILIDSHTQRIAFRTKFDGGSRWIAFEVMDHFDEASTRIRTLPSAKITDGQVTL